MAEATQDTKPQAPVFGEIAPPPDPLRPRLAAVDAMPFTTILSPTDSILAAKGGIGNLAIYRELLRDDQVASTWSQRRLALTRCDTVVEPGADDDASRAAAEELQAELDAINWDDITDKALFAVFYGWGVSEVMWRPEGDRVRFDRIIVRDRARFRFDRQDKLYLYENAWELMPERKFWTVRSGADNHDDLYGLGLAHSLYWPVFFKRSDIKFWLIFLEKFGAPTAIAKMPAGKMANPEEVAKATAMLRNIATDSGIVVPDDVVVELLEAARSGAGDYGAMHAAMDGAISKIVVGQTMTTDNGSSRSQGEVHERVAQKIVEADSDLLCASFNMGPVRWWFEFNAGAFPGATAPRVYRATEPPEDLNARADRDAKISALGYEPDENYIRETYGEGWVKKSAPVQAPGMNPFGGMPGQPNPIGNVADPAQFAEGELAALQAMKAARRADQDALADAAVAFAEQYQTITGRRVGQILEAAEFAEDYQTFRARIDEILAEVPPVETAEKVVNGNVFARLMGALRQQRKT